MSRRKDDSVRDKSPTVLCGYACNPAVADIEACYFCMEFHAAAEGFDLRPEASDNIHEHIGSHMRLCVPEDVLRRAGFHKQTQNLLVPSAPVVYAGIQFSVRKCAGTALTELDVGFRIQCAALPEFLYLFPTDIGGISALEHNGPVPVLRQHPCAENACRSASDDDRRTGELPVPRRRKVITDLRRLLYIRTAPAAAEDLFFSWNFRVNRIDVTDIFPVSRVNGTAHDAYAVDIVCGDVKRVR